MDLKLLHNLIDSAAQVYPGNEIMQQVAVTQAILESGFLSKSGGSQLALRYNNLFGIKQMKGYKATPPLTTWEHINGKDIQVKVPFAAFEDHEECFRAYKELMDRPRYNSVITALSVPEAFKELVKDGYATNPMYAINLKDIWIEYVKDNYT